MLLFTLFTVTLKSLHHTYFWENLFTDWIFMRKNIVNKDIAFYKGMLYNVRESEEKYCELIK